MWYVTDIKGLCLYSGVACLPVDGAPSCLTTATMGGQAQASSTVVEVAAEQINAGKALSSEDLRELRAACHTIREAAL